MPQAQIMTIDEKLAISNRSIVLRKAVKYYYTTDEFMVHIKTAIAEENGNTSLLDKFTSKR